MKASNKARRQKSDHVIIDEELEALIPRLSPEELAQLEQNLLAEGCREKLIAWDDGRQKRLLDGHNRRAICKRHGLPYEVECISLPDREAAIQWILRHQLGRRNLSPEAMSYLRGRMYCSAKRQGERTDLTSGHSAQKLTTAEQIAAQYKVDEKTIRRDAQFAEQIDRLAKESGSQIKNEVLARDARITRKDVPRLLALEKSAREQVVAGIRGGTKASVLLRELGRGGGNDNHGERKRSDGARSSMSAALEHLEIAVSILRGLPAGSDSGEILERIDAQVQLLPKEVERHRAALQRPDAPRVDVLAVVEAVFEMESEGILKAPPMTATDAFFADPTDPKALDKQFAELRERIQRRAASRSRPLKRGRHVAPANDVIDPAESARPLSYKTYETIQRYLGKHLPTLKRLSSQYAATRAENPEHARICEKIDRFIEMGGSKIFENGFSYAHYIKDQCPDPQVFHEAARAMVQEMAAYLRALNQFAEKVLQGMRHSTMKQGSAPSAPPGRVPLLPSTQAPKPFVGGAPSTPTHQAPRSTASASIGAAQAWQPSLAVAASASAEPDRSCERPTQEQIEQEVSQLIDDLCSGRLRYSFQAEQAIRQKNWPCAEQDKALKLFFAMFGQVLPSRRTTTPLPSPQSVPTIPSADPRQASASPLPPTTPPFNSTTDTGTLSKALKLLERAAGRVAAGHENRELAPSDDWIG
ncbi:hypothetical protein [Polyangium aurulentum]|uniref:hypothetical protein n=1 Tax=Polyangium aurulentum TaxID=2567896 RepID=UPI0010AE6AB6|nr:hypothetical protein [Polyangium aurulentum]UQA63208.1 hypothetical protein E8A73_023185 [Polyangium aurulentum]